MTRKPRDGWSDPTPYENFLYLLATLETVVERGIIEWPASQADVILIRFARLNQKVALALGEAKGRGG